MSTAGLQLPEQVRQVCIQTIATGAALIFQLDSVSEENRREEKSSNPWEYRSLIKKLLKKKQQECLRRIARRW